MTKITAIANLALPIVSSVIPRSKPIQQLRKQKVPGKHIQILMSALIIAVFATTACEEEVIPTQVPVEFHPTAAPVVERPDSSSMSAEVVVSIGGDSAVGEVLFSNCSACHSTGEDTVVGPGLAGVYDRAGTRTSLDAEAYLVQSIREPSVYLVEGFAALMPAFDQLSDQDIQDLIAYLKTLN